MAKYLYIVAFILPMLACGTQLVGFTNPTPQAVPTPPLVMDAGVEMTVSGTWNIRVEPGETSPLVEGKHILNDGETVICREFRVVGDGSWCRHDRGWTNAKGMEAEP